MGMLDGDQPRVLIICPVVDLLAARVAAQITAAGGSVKVVDAAALSSLKFTLTQPNSPALAQLVEGADWSVSLDELTGLWLTAQWFTTGSSGMSEKDSVFVGTEYAGFLRFLAHTLSCTVINRLRPELWGYNTIDPQLVRRLAPQSFEQGILILPSTVIAAGCVTQTQLDSLPDSVALWPFSDGGQTLAISTRQKQALGHMEYELPLRFQHCGSLAPADVFVVGDSAYGERCDAVGDDLLAHSVSICRELDLVFGQVLWMQNQHEAFLAGIKVCPSADGLDREQLDAMAAELARELMNT